MHHPTDLLPVPGGPHIRIEVAGLVVEIYDEPAPGEWRDHGFALACLFADDGVELQRWSLPDSFTREDEAQSVTAAILQVRPSLEQQAVHTDVASALDAAYEASQ